MVIDSSALAAIFFHETEREEFLERLERAEEKFISAATLLEASMVIRRELAEAGVTRLFEFIELSAIEVIAFDHEQSLIAVEAFRVYGKGRQHRASLNMGDCFSYALAKKLNVPLLFKGNDFIWTDIMKA